jgi:mono/diheme cytochrome c family protein
MRSVAVLSLAIVLAALAGCGQKSADTAGTSSEPAAPAAPAGGGASGGVAAVSKYDSGPRAIAGEIDEAKAAHGKQLFSTKGCSACHAIGRRLTGPDLAGVASRRTAEWIENQILHPDVMVKTDPISHQLFGQFSLQMPNQGLTPEEARAVIEFFKQNDHEAGEKSASGEKK